MAQDRYFRRTVTGEWYAGMHSTDGSFPTDGQSDADSIAAACGWSAGAVEPVTQDASLPDPRTGTLFSEPVSEPPPDPLAADKQRLWEFMPASDSATATAVTNYIANANNPPALRATMAALRSLIRVVYGERQA